MRSRAGYCDQSVFSEQTPAALGTLSYRAPWCTVVQYDSQEDQALNLCVVCGFRPVHKDDAEKEICSHHLSWGVEHDKKWSDGNRAACNFFHRGEGRLG